MNDLSCGLTYVSETYLWLETYEDLRRFVTEVLNLKGKWKAPGGDVKVFKSEGEREYIIKWLGPRSRKLFIQSDDDEGNLKSKLEKLINWGPNNANCLYEASVNEVCSNVCEVTEPSVSQSSCLKADFASLVDITSDLITQINSMRSKQKDFESVIRKQDSEICRLNEENMLLTSSLLSLENSIFELMNNNAMTNSSTNSTKLITSNDPTTINKDRVIDPDINTSYTTGPTSLNEFNTHNEITTENTANEQPSVLNSDLNQPTENIINTFHIPKTTPLNESGMHNESVFIVNDQLSCSNDQLGASNADPVNSSKLTEIIDLNKASKIKPTTTGSVTGRFNRPFSKCPKHLTPCPFLRKRRFCKKGNNCDFLHENRQFHNNMQRPFFNTIDQAAPLPRFYYPPFPVNPGYFPPFRFPTYHPTSLPSLYPPPLMSVQTKPPTVY